MRFHSSCFGSVRVLAVLGVWFGSTYGSIASSGYNPDWSFSKAELVEELYSYEPQGDAGGGTGVTSVTTRQHRSLFPIFSRGSPSGNNPQKRRVGQLMATAASQIQPQHSYLPPTNIPPPKYTKFSLQDKKEGPAGLKLIGPVYEHQTPATPTTTTDRNSQKIDTDGRETIIWPDRVAEKLATDISSEESQLRFVVHKEGDEGEIRRALEDDGAARGQSVQFIEGPTLRIQRHQKVYLPPKKKTLVYVLLKEPQISTNVEVVTPPEEDTAPEVFITYQKSDGGVKTKHYSPDKVKGDKILSHLKEEVEPPGGGYKNHLN